MADLSTLPPGRPLRGAAVGLRLLPFAVSGACIWLLATRFDWSAVGGALMGAHWPLVVVAVGLVLAYLPVRAVRWRLMLGATAPPFGTVLRVYAVSIAVAAAIPGSGEVVRAVALGRRGGVPTAYVLGTVAVEKGLDTALTLMLMLLGLWTAALRDEQVDHLLLGAALLTSAGLLAGIALLAALVRWLPPGAVWTPPQWVPPRLARLLARLVAVSLAAAERFGSGARAIWHLPRRRQAAILALTLVSWVATWLLTLAALAAFGLAVQGALAAVLWGALALGLSVPSAPGGLGTFQLVVVTVLQAFDQPVAPSLAFAIGFHALTAGPIFLAGAVASLRGRPRS